MSIADEIRKLEELRQQGLLTDEEFARAKASVLDGDRPEGDLTDLNRRQTLTELDQSWASEKEQYMVQGRYGHRSIPSKTGSLLGGVAIAGFGVVWTIMAASIGGNAPGGFGSIFPVFGVLFILFGVGMSIYSYNKATAYETAYQRYRRRRGELSGDDTE